MFDFSVQGAVSAISMLVFAGLAWATVELFLGQRSVRPLEEVDPDIDATLKWPRVSVVIPARNEQRKLRSGLESVLELDYPELEIIAIDDRSEDATGAILDAIAAGDRRVRTVHVRELPEGWLGKNHALDQGARLASGEWLLFADADVVMAPSTLRRAIHRCLSGSLDHLTVAPRVDVPDLPLKVAVNVFMVYFSLFFRPWKAPNPRSRSHVGIGAFNLVRTAAYRACGGHRPIRMRPDDDVRLGRLLKRNGFRQAQATGATLIQVQWYATVGELVDGLLKNMFAGFDYRFWMVVGATIGQVVCFLWPFLGLFAVEGAARLANLGTVLLILCLYAAAARHSGTPAWHAVAFPLGVLLMLYILWKSTLTTLWTGGIRWRGTFYPLSALKAKMD